MSISNCFSAIFCSLFDSATDTVLLLLDSISIMFFQYFDAVSLESVKNTHHSVFH